MKIALDCCIRCGKIADHYDPTLWICDECISTARKNALEIVIGAAEAEVRTMEMHGWQKDSIQEIKDAIKIVLDTTH